MYDLSRVQLPQIPGSFLCLLWQPLLFHQLLKVDDVLQVRNEPSETHWIPGAHKRKNLCIFKCRWNPDKISNTMFVFGAPGLTSPTEVMSLLSPNLLLVVAAIFALCVCVFFFSLFQIPDGTATTVQSSRTDHAHVAHSVSWDKTRDHSNAEYVTFSGLFDKNVKSVNSSRFLLPIWLISCLNWSR